MRRLTWVAVVAISLLSATQALSQATVRPCVTTGANSCPPVSASDPLPVTGTLTVAPVTATTTQAKVTIAATNTFQAALALSATRKGCTVQYVAVAGTVGLVFFGSATPADTTTSFRLSNGQSLNCGLLGGGVATDQVLITGTQNDIFIVSNQ